MFEDLDPVALKYANTMEEIKRRLHAIGRVVEWDGLESEFAIEFGYLNLRIICELVGLACLIAHGDVHDRADLAKTWEAPKIMRKLQKLKPDFFPQACSFGEPDVNGKRLMEFRVGDFLTMQEVVVLWQRTGSQLHAGTLKNYTPPMFYNSAGTDDVVYLANRMVNLLNNHIIKLSDKRWFFVILSEKTTKQVQVATVMAP